MGDSENAQRYDTILRQAARSLAETLASYRTLTRGELATLSGVDHWPSVDFDAALQCGMTLGLIRPLAEDLYEVPRDPPAA